MRAVALGVAEHLLDQHVVRAFPALEHHRIAIQAHQRRKGFDRAVAAQDLHRQPHHLRVAHAGPVLVHVDADAEAERKLVVGGAERDAVGLRGQPQARRRARAIASARSVARLRRPAGSRRFFAEGAAMARERRGFAPGGVHRTRAADRVEDARSVEHVLDHVLEPAVELADRLGERADEVDFGRRHRARPELALQPAHAEIVDAARRFRAVRRTAPRPRVPGGAPSGRAVIKNSFASITEQNHFSPKMRKCAPSLRATTALAPTSEPPCTSVRNCEAWMRSVVVARQKARQPLGFLLRAADALQAP